MNKSKLERFIQKYNLGGAVERAIWTFKNNKLSTTFVTSDKSLLGKVSVDNFIFEDVKLGVYSTNQLQRLLNVVGDNIDISLTKANKSAVSLKISEGDRSRLQAFEGVCIARKNNSINSRDTNHRKKPRQKTNWLKLH